MPDSGKKRSHPVWSLFRYLALIGALALPALWMVWVSDETSSAHFMRSWVYVVAPALGLFLLTWWYLIFGWGRFLPRLTVFLILQGVFLLVGVAGKALFRYEGSAGGSSLPQLVPVWVESAEEQQAELLPDLPADRTAGVTSPEFESPDLNAEIEGLEPFPQFYGPERNGRVRQIASFDWTAQPPEELWRIPIGVGWSGFAVPAKGRHLITQEQRGEEEWITCYDLLEGTLLWKQVDPARFDETMSGPGPRCTPTVLGPYLWTLGATGILNCLEWQSGVVIWSRNIFDDTGATYPEWGCSSSPLVADDLVIVAGGDREATLLAYEARTGSPVWTYEGKGASYSSPMVMELAGHRQLVSVNAFSVTGHDLSSGERLWHFDWPGKFPKVGQPVKIDENRVLVTASYGAGSHLLEVTPGPGQSDEAEKEGEEQGDDPPKAGQDTWEVSEIWETNRLKTKFSSAVVKDGFAYGLDEGIFACIDLSDGSRMWKGGRYGFGQQLLVGDDTLLIQAERGDVVLVRATPDFHEETGRLVGALSEKGKSWNVPTLAGRYLILRNDFEAACFRLGSE